MCAQAANHIAHIGKPPPPFEGSVFLMKLLVSVYADYYCPRRASVFLCYYVFTAAVMHVATRKSFS